MTVLMTQKQGILTIEMNHRDAQEIVDSFDEVTPEEYQKGEEPAYDFIDALQELVVNAYEELSEERHTIEIVIKGTKELSERFFNVIMGVATGMEQPNFQVVGSVILHKEPEAKNGKKDKSK